MDPAEKPTESEEGADRCRAESDSADRCREILKSLDNRGLVELAGIAQAHREMMVTAEISKIHKALSALTYVWKIQLGEIIKQQGEMLGHNKTIEGILKDICGKMPEPKQ